ncbi:MAG: hypothetical protein AB1416_04695 [Actinomycetota bacterium]
MSQFFATNPQSRPATGAKEGRWSREIPADWRSALGLAPNGGTQDAGSSGSAPKQG